APINLVQADILRYQIHESILIVGADKFATTDISVRVRGRSHTWQVYDIRPLMVRAAVAYYIKYFYTTSALELKKTGTAGPRFCTIA
ncbi:hypothetical protein SISNIDRAFT_383437, partial [Sistotremastrum niveocremeum HHB9708]